MQTDWQHLNICSFRKSNGKGWVLSILDSYYDFLHSFLFDFNYCISQTFIAMAEYLRETILKNKFILTHGFSPWTTGFTAMGLWWGRIPWLQVCVAEEAAHLTAARNPVCVAGLASAFLPSWSPPYWLVSSTYRAGLPPLSSYPTHQSSLKTPSQTHLEVCLTKLPDIT
jgi:hypothetical protein